MQSGQKINLGLNGFGEVLNILAKLSVNYASLLAPLAIVQVINGFQPVFVFLEGIMLSLLIPSSLKEKLDRPTLVKKTISILIMCVGVYFLTTG